MERFELLTTVSDLLRGKDSSVWHEILEKAVQGEDPYLTRVPQVQVLEVNRSEGVDPENLIAHLQQKGEMEVDEKIIAAFEREKKTENFRIRKTLGLYNNGEVLIQFAPDMFGIEYNEYEPNGFGAKASVAYPKVVESAIKYGFKQPDLVSALYFRSRFLDAHRYTEGTSYYVACKPVLYADDQLPIIPVLDYDRYRGWAIRGCEVGGDTLLNMSFGTGQGEHFESTFVFALER
ncbi:MAG: hypothetical protein V4436_00820 [Patescibacteria group bacterium]